MDNVQKLNLLAEIAATTKEYIKNMSVEEQVELLHDAAELLIDEADDLESD